MKTLLLSFMAAFLLLGCARSFPTPEQITNANFGQPPNKTKYEERILGHFSQTLFDSESARYKFGTPYKAAWPRSGGEWDFGYGVDVLVNAKNRYGAYVGFQKYYFFFGKEDVYVDEYPTIIRRLE